MSDDLEKETDNTEFNEQEEIEDKYVWDKRHFIIALFALIVGIIGVLGKKDSFDNTQIFYKSYKPNSTIYNNPQVHINSSPNVINNSNIENNTNIVNNNGVLNNSSEVNNNINTNIINNLSATNNSQAANDNVFSDIEAEKREMQKEFERDKLELKRQMKQKFLENFSKSQGINEQNSEYPTGWYGFAFPSKYEQTFKSHNISYIRLNTNKGNSFNDLCKSINKTCTTTIKGSFPGKPRDYGCEIKDEDYLAFCE